MHMCVPWRTRARLSGPAVHWRWCLVAAVSLCVPVSGDSAASHVVSLFCLCAQTPVFWLSCSPWDQLVVPKAGRDSGDKTTNRTRMLIHTPGSGVFNVRVSLVWISMPQRVALSRFPPVFWGNGLQSWQLTVGWARTERHSLPCLYSPSQGHADVMNTSFCYLEWAVHSLIPFFFFFFFAKWT